MGRTTNISFYGDATDVAWLNDWLGQQEEIAWIVSAGRKRWRAVEQCDITQDGCYCIWHVPSGRLPLYPQHDPDGPPEWIEDPWDGWVEPDWKPPKAYYAVPPESQEEMRRNWAGRDEPDAEPYFGAGHVGIIELKVRTEGEQPGEIGLSSVGWIATHYSRIGNKPADSTTAWFAKLERAIQGVAIKVTREGPLRSPRPEVWALPSALWKIETGAPRQSV